MSSAASCPNAVRISARPSTWMTTITTPSDRHEARSMMSALAAAKVRASMTPSDATPRSVSHS